MPGKKLPYSVVEKEGDDVLRVVEDNVKSTPEALGWIRWKGRKGRKHHVITDHGGPYTPDGQGGLEGKP